MVNAIQVEPPSHLKMHNVINIMHTVSYFEQPDKITAEVPNKLDPVPKNSGEEYGVQSILIHRKKWKGLQFLTLMKVDPTHDAFVDPDGTMNEKLYEYKKEHSILEHFGIITLTLLSGRQ